MHTGLVRRAFGACAVALAAATLSPMAATADFVPDATAETERYIVTVVDPRSNAVDAVEAIAADRLSANAIADSGGVAGPVVVAELETLGAAIVDMTPSDASTLARVDGIVVEPDTRVHATDISWGLDRIDQDSNDLDGRFLAATTGEGVTIHVVDTGIRSDHREFDGRIRPGADFIDEGGDGRSDCHGHGTHVASIAAGATRGVAPAATIVPVRVLDCKGAGWTSRVAAAVDWIIAESDGPSVVNMSLGGSPSPALDAAVERASSLGHIVVVASGNGGGDACDASPSRAQSALTVAATTRGDLAARFSDLGSCVDMFAPGMGIPGAGRSGPDAVATMSGTSQAAPHVAGVAALLLSDGVLSSEEVVAELIASSRSGVGGVDAETPDRLMVLPESLRLEIGGVSLTAVGTQVLVSFEANAPVGVTVTRPNSQRTVTAVPGPDGVARLAVDGASEAELTIAGLTYAVGRTEPTSITIDARYSAAPLGWPDLDLVVVRRSVTSQPPDETLTLWNGDHPSITRFGDDGLGTALVPSGGSPIEVNGTTLVASGVH